MSSKTYYVFVNADGSYRLGQVGEIASAASVPVSRPYPSMALAHDNLMQRQHMPLNDRQRAEIEALEQVYGAGGAKGSVRNQAFFDALLRENRWAAGELRPAHACRTAVLSVINPPHAQPPQLIEMERAVGVGVAAPRLHQGVPTLRERGGRSPRKEREVGHDRT